MASNGPVGIRAQEGPSLIVGRIVGLASCFVGAALTLVWLALRVSPALGQRFAMIPFFDGPLILTYNKPFVSSAGRTFTAMAPLLIHLVIAGLLVAVGLLILRRHRWSVPAFLITGWGGLIFVLLAVWPGERIRAKLEFALGAARRQGMLPEDGTLIDLVPTSVFVAVGAFLVVWLLLLIAGSLHLVRQRKEYNL